MKKFLALFVVIVLFAALFGGCNTEKPSEPSEREESSALESSEPEEALPEKENAYLSINYIRRDNPTDTKNWDTVFYTYDLDEKQLTEQFRYTSPLGFTGGVYSLSDKKGYLEWYSKIENPNSGVCLYYFDNVLGDGMKILDKALCSYSDMTMMNPDTLLFEAETRDHYLMPAKYDIPSKTITYMADVNGEDPMLYTCGAAPVSYNYKTRELVCIYQNNEEMHSEEYHSGGEINTYIALVPESLIKDPDRVYPVSLDINHSIASATQISENEILVKMRETHPEATDPDDIYTYSFYMLVFSGGKASFSETDSPYPGPESVGGICTVDEGKTYYFILHSEIREKAGLYSYVPETGELTPILLDNSFGKGEEVIGFSIIGE